MRAAFLFARIFDQRSIRTIDHFYYSEATIQTRTICPPIVFYLTNAIITIA
jgi:hypothetical protein